LSLATDQTAGSVVAMPRAASDPWRIAIAGVALIVLIRLLLAAFTPLTEDEAYYRLWSQHLAFGYYDHPPMIALWVRLGVTIIGDTPLGVRLLPVLASLATSALVFDLGRRLSGRVQTGAWAVLWYNATVTVGVGAVLAAPDAPASLFWALTLWCLSRTGENARWWLAAGAAAGLGVMSKYSALFLAPGALLWLVSSADRRRMLARPWPWLGAVLAAVIASPNLVWNAQHHWLTFLRQFGRVVPPGFAPVHLVELLALQSLLFGPVLIFYVWQAVRARAPGMMLIAATSAPFLAYLLFHSLHSQVEQHWPVPLFAGAAVLGALGADAWPGPRWLRALPLAGFAIPPLTLLYVALPISPVPRDPALPVEGWPNLSRAIAERQAAAGAGWVGTVSYGVLAELEAAPVHPTPVIQLDERDRYRGWPTDGRYDPARPGLVVDLDRRMDTALLSRCFGRVQDLGGLDRGRPGAVLAVYRLYLVAEPKFDVLNVGCPSRKEPGAH